MKTQPIVPAQIEWQDGVPYAPAFGDVYHAKAGAFAQAREVFLAGNGLPARWLGRARFVVLETGFGLGNNFLATWAAWRADPERAERLVFVSIEKHPPAAADMARAHAASPEPELAKALLAAWPPATHALHTIEFDSGAVTLQLAFGDLTDWLPELQLSADAIYLDGFAPARNAAMWDAYALRALGRLAAPGATAATWSAARAVRDALASAGFRAQHVPGFAGKREMTVAAADSSATEQRRSAPPGRRNLAQARTALVVGAGLAGSSAARALARQGLQVTVLEAAGEPATGASGNPAALFHGVVHADDGQHAQLLRAAALRATHSYGPLIESGRVPGELQGLLRGSGDAPWQEMQALVELQALPADYVEALTREQASARAGCALAGPAWHYPGGGWLQPAALAREWLATTGVTLQAGTPVAAVSFIDGRWLALDEEGRAIASADLVIVAAASGALPLLAPHCGAAGWPWRRTRGQLTLVPPTLAAGLPRPALPIASGGYLITLPDALGAGLLCGASSQADDEEPSLRAADHRANLAQIAALTGTQALADTWFDENGSALDGRVAWRLALDDRLPLVGPVPQQVNELRCARRLEQPRHVPRVTGLYVFTALGSRGVTWAPLLGELLAAGIVGAPLPLPGSLVDALDPARFVSRAVRQPAR